MHLKDHAGQVSLPGGRLADGESVAEAALREASEEVGLTPESVEVIGTLDRFLTGTGFTITPVVGIVADPTFVATPDPREVAGVFEVPLTLILDRTAMSIGYFERHGSRLLTYELDYGGRYSHSYMDALPDFVKLAEAYGHVGLKIEKPGDVEPALREAIKLKDRTVFLDVRTDPTENVWPMVQAGKGISEMLLGSEDL